MSMPKRDAEHISDVIQQMNAKRLRLENALVPAPESEIAAEEQMNIDEFIATHFCKDCCELTGYPMEKKNCLCTDKHDAIDSDAASTRSGDSSPIATAPQTPRDRVPAVEGISTPLSLGLSGGSSRPSLSSSVSSDSTKEDSGVVHPCAAVMNQLHSQHPPCVKCGFPCDPIKSRIHTKANGNSEAKWCCLKCAAVQRMLTRKLDVTGPLCLDNMDPEHVKSFFQRAKTSFSDDRLHYSQIRGFLKEAMTTQSISQRKSKTSISYKPLSCWAKEGYDTARIEAANITENNPVLGIVYGVPLRCDSWEAVEKEVEEVIRTAERRLTSKTAKDGTALAEGWDTSDGTEAAAAAAGSVPAPLNETEQQRQKRLAREAKAKQTADAAEKRLADAAAEKLRKQTMTNNNKISAFSSRVICSVKPILQKLEACKAHKEFSHCPEVLQNALLQHLNTASVAVKDAEQAMKAYATKNKKGEPLDEPSLDSNALKELLTESKKDISKWAVIERMSLSSR